MHHTNPNNSKDNQNLKLLTIGSPVGHTNSAVMIGKDKVYVFGGKQNGDAYSSSNKVLEIDFADSFNPKIKKLNPMFSPRSNGNATILPIKICDNTVIGAGAVVTKDITESGIYIGNPARLLRKL